MQDKLNCQVSRNRLVYGTTHAAIKDIVVVGIVLGRCVEGGSGRFVGGGKAEKLGDIYK